MRPGRLVVLSRCVSSKVYMPLPLLIVVDGALGVWGYAGVIALYESF